MHRYCVTHLCTKRRNRNERKVGEREKRAGRMTQRSAQQTQVFPVILNKAELNRDLINFTVFTFQLHFSVVAVKKTVDNRVERVYPLQRGTLTWWLALITQAQLKGTRCNAARDRIINRNGSCQFVSEIELLEKSPVFAYAWSVSVCLKWQHHVFTYRRMWVSSA